MEVRASPVTNNMKRQAIKRLLLIGGLCVALSIGSIMAYFTDTDAAENSFTVGKVSLDLQEPGWDPDNGKGLTPGKRIGKDPRILNDGVNDEYVFMEVRIPCAHIATANPDGTKNPAKDVQLWDFEANEGWTRIGDVRKDDDSGMNVYLYAYGSDQSCTRLAKDEVTPPLFQSVVFANAVEGQGLEEKVMDIGVYAYGIQTENILDGKASPKEVWEVLKNQSL